MHFQIEYIRISDDTEKEPETGLYQPSEVSIYVAFKQDGNDFYLDFRTTATHDSGAYSSELSADEGTRPYKELENYCGENEIDFDTLIGKVKKVSSAQDIWFEYMKENYVRNESHFGGMDGNSEINEMSKI